MDQKNKDMREKPVTTSTGLMSNIAGLLCYLVGFVTGIVFLVIEKENRFVRFHAMQSTFVFGALFILNLILGFLPIIGWFISLLIGPITLILWVVLMYKAYQGEYFKLPFVGDLAEQQLK
ncbi:DUF4870 domain-containing protein [Brevibacillus ruminantium]|uniref:DUF4870 domain-containing protein n=1 Tax=Brevibacillus ruminantium TaxID=2950604 RepID=A0ABY4WDV6_9BACL|nr:DUF4870 domain-containing protein [Brevibacillus ruminantium]USG65355.1 DUF4870 domain-containing protein [Brevibacillus ruminantium]